MRLVNTLALLAVGLSLVAAQGGIGAETGVTKKGVGTTLIFADEFDTLNFTTWQHEITAGGGGNWEFQYYTNNRSNSYVKNSVLYIKPTLTADTFGEANLHAGFTLDLWGSTPAGVCTGNQFYGCERIAGGGGNIINPIQSARLRSVKAFKFQYGSMEVKMKMPKGDWLWPAFWLLPAQEKYGGWPASGEIDFIEARGNGNGYPNGVDTVGSTLHWGPFPQWDSWPKSHNTYTLGGGKDFSQDFHIFTLNWTETGISTAVDGNVIMSVPFDVSFWERGGWTGTTVNNPWVGRGKSAPFDQDFYIIMNLAVGGMNDYWPDGVGKKPWSMNDPHGVNAFYTAKDQWLPTWSGEDCALQIDYIRVYQ